MTPTTAAEQIVAAFPGFVIETVEFAGAGQFCRAYTVNQEWIFRFARHAEASESLAREARLMPRLAPTLSLPVPQIEFLGRQEETGLSLAGHRRVADIPLTQSLFLSLDAPARLRCTRDLANFLRQLHSFPVASAANAGVQAIDYPAHSARLYAEAQQILFPRIDREVQAHCRRVLERFADAPSLLAYSPVLLHGDLSPDHILFDPAQETITGIIDFGDVLLGDSDYDLRLLYEDYGMEFLRLFLRHWPAADQRALPAKVHFYHEWGTIGWVLDTLRQGDAEAIREALDELQMQCRQSFDNGYL